MGRVVIPDADKMLVREYLLRGFQSLEASEEDARKALDAGSIPVYLWVARWIAHNTDYPQTRAIRLEDVRHGLYAWIHYKSTVETLTKENFEQAEQR